MILGIWDGHDAGACLIEGGKVLAALNEERLSRKKLDIGFPALAAAHCLKLAGADPSQVTAAALSTSDLAKTLGRIFPALPQKHYQFRRRKQQLPFTNWQKQFKFWLTSFGPSPMLARLSEQETRKSLARLGFSSYQFRLIDHHRAHACAAAFASPFEEAAVITLDGLGDGASGSISKLSGGTLEEIKRISALNSLGIFFEQVTYLLNMRELEDEGKVMALADYSLPIPAEKNPLNDLFTVQGLELKARLTPRQMFNHLGKLLWQTPFEQFARMAQDTLQDKAVQLVANALSATGKSNLCLAGGLFANVKLNMLLRKLPQTKGWFVFPHMGDGGLALGTAAAADYEINGRSRIDLSHVFFGSSFGEPEMEAALKTGKLHYRKESDIAKIVAELIAKGEIVLWFQGAGEYGPRALGHRSILAPADSLKVKDDLNLKLKRRSWFQPFCPSMLEEDALELLADYGGESSPFMTMAYAVKPEARERLEAVISIDGSCRPQILPRGEKSLYRELIETVKQLKGTGCVLNTSFNLHGEPLVETPADAVQVMTRYNFPYLAMGDFLASGDKSA